LIHALSKRYASPVPQDRAPLDAAYAEAMRDVWRQFPDDAEVGALCAEALMDLHPWDLWTNQGQAKPWTPEIVEIIERVLAIEPGHALANHLYVHALEASSNPGRASAAADRLREMVPGSSHLVHMPAHIDARVGHYEAASRANEIAIAVDAKHADRTGRAGFYRIYMAHNVHFLTFSSMMEGRRAEALSAAKRVASGFTPEFLELMGPFIDGFLPIVLEVEVRFGMWEEILREPTFPDLFGVSNSVRHYARGVAFTALDRFDEAHSELAQLEDLAGAMDERPIGNNPARLVLRIPLLVLKGELAFREGRREEGIEHLRAAVAVEDQLLYDEPPDWIMPVRHTLGAALVAAGRYVEAEKVYVEDLQRWPENGWSLQGLLLCAEGRGLARETDEIRARFQRAWARADVSLTTSCFCQARR
jgi:tetratricopeptide (TPR) repeat protein